MRQVTAREKVPAAALMVCLSVAPAWAQVRGRVLVDGRPAAGASVAARPFESRFEEARREARDDDPPATLATVATAADGTFTLSLPAPAKGAAPHPPLRLWVTAANAPTTVVARVVGADESADVGDIDLEPGQELSGRVVDVRGAPVEGARVWLDRRRDRKSQDGDWPVAVTRTDAKGAFRFRNAQPDSNRVTAVAPGRGIATRAGLSAGALSSPLVLAPGGSLDVSVKRAGTRAAAAGALVRVEGPGAAARWIETDALGRARLEGVPAGGGLRVVALAPDGAAAATATAGAPLTLVLAPPGALHGHVVDARTRAPLAGRRLLADGDEGRGTTVSAADGTYAIAGLPTGSYELRVDDERAAPYVQRDLRVTAGARLAHDVALAPAAALRGQVVDERGRPVAGAQVTALRPSAEPPGPFGPPRLDSVGGSRSGADGGFVLPRLSPGSEHTLVVLHPDLLPAVLSPPPAGADGAAPPLRVVLRSGLALRGRVRDASGRPIAAAKVFLDREDDATGSPWHRPPFEVDRATRKEPAQTGADGRFEARGLAAGRYSLHVRAQGWADERLDHVRVDDEAGAPLDLELRRGATLRGFVRDTLGEPQAGRSPVARESGDHAPDQFWERWQRASEPTGPDGAFTIEGLVPGVSYDVSLTPQGEAPLTGVAAPAEGLELLTRRALRVSGTVSDADSGAPLTDFELAYSPAAAHPVTSLGATRRLPGQFEAMHADDGRFVLDGIPPGTWNLEGRAPGYQPARLALAPMDEGQDPAPVELRLSRGVALAGRVLSASDAQPIVGASLRLDPIKVSSTGVRVMARGDGLDTQTDADGRFRITGLGPGRYTVTASHPDFTAADDELTLEGGGREGFELRLGRGATLAGVALASGLPVADAIVTLVGGPSPAEHRFASWESRRRTATTDPDGRFRFSGLAKGSYGISARSATRSSAPVKLDLGEGEARANLRLELHPGATLRGRVTGLEPELLGQVRVSAWTRSNWSGAARSEDGAFTLEGVPAGEVSLSAQAGDPRQGLRSANAQVTVPESLGVIDVEIAFQPGLRLEGRVTRAGAPVPHALVSAHAAPLREPGGMTTVVTDDAGAFILMDLRPGTYSLNVMGTQGHAHRRVELPAPGPVVIELPTGRLAGVVVDADTRRPVVEAAVSLATSEGVQVALRTDSAGRFLADSLPSQPLRLRVEHAGYAAYEAPVTPDEGQDVRVELRPAPR